MINSFQQYLENGRVKRKTPDPEEAKSLIRKAKKRLKYMFELDQESAELVLEASYDALREAAQSLMSLRGYKPYSHEGTISFIKKFYSEDFDGEVIAKFDRFRQLRTSSVYRGIKVNIQDAKACREFAKKMVRKIEKVKN